MGRITQAELARQLGISSAAVTKAKKAGRITVGGDGLVDEAEALAQWKERTRAAMRAASAAEAGEEEKRPRGGQTKYSSARARREHARAAREEMALARERGELCETASLRHAAADVGAWWRQTLEGWPERLAGELAMKQPAEIAALLRVQIEDLQNQLVARLQSEIDRLPVNQQAS